MAHPLGGSSCGSTALSSFLFVLFCFAEFFSSFYYEVGCFFQFFHIFLEDFLVSNCLPTSSLSREAPRCGIYPPDFFFSKL